MADSRDMQDIIEDFSRAFGRPVNREVVELNSETRILLAKLLFEKTQEYIEKGLGLQIVPVLNLNGDICRYDIEDRGGKYDPIESADGLGNVNVIINFNAAWHGFNLRRVTLEIHDSNMSKLGEDGKPIINRCTGCQNPDLTDTRVVHDSDEHTLLDPTKPMGKILKGPNFRKPDIAKVIYGHSESRND